jgi:threonylcarbamoyladenosine tRNA methylthiotransferase MtaB
MRVRLETLGCRLNEAELESWARQFRARGFGIAAEGEPADLGVVNSQQQAQRDSSPPRRTEGKPGRLAAVISNSSPTSGA